MTFRLPYSAKVSIKNNYNCETEIEIEDSYDKLKTSIMNEIFNDDGIDTLSSCISDDMFNELLNSKTNLLNEYLTRNGYVFNGKRG